MNIGIDFEKFQKEAVPQVMTNYTKMPNLIIDDRIMARISDKAFKCLMFIMRQTVGFGRASHTIAITQFQKYCGIKKRDTVMAVIRELEQCKLIKVERKTGCLNEYFLTLDQYRETGLVPFDGSTVKGDGTSTFERDGTSTVKRDSIKETLKEKFKEIHTQEDSTENSVDEVLNLWKPNLYSLNSWLQRAGEKPINQAQMENTLLEVNAHYERHIRSGAVSDSKMYSNFVKWVKGDYSKYRKPNQPATQKANRNVNDAWGAEQHYEPASDIDCGGLI